MQLKPHQRPSKIADTENRFRRLRLEGITNPHVAATRLREGKVSDVGRQDIARLWSCDPGVSKALSATREQ